MQVGDDAIRIYRGVSTCTARGDMMRIEQDAGAGYIVVARVQAGYCVLGLYRNVVPCLVG